MPDPVMDFRVELNDAYARRINPDDERLIAFLDRLVGPNGEVTFAEDALADIDDFVVASALLRIVISGDVPPTVGKRFAFEAHPTSLVNTRYMKCPGFTVYRTGLARNAA
jgi:hypothetical protein